MFKGLIYSVLSALGFSTLPIFAKLCYEAGFSPSQILFYRFSFGMLSVFVLILLSGKISVLMLSRSNLLIVTLISAGLFLPESFLFVSSIKYIPAVTAELILYLYPISVVIISWLVFGQRLNKQHLLAAVITFAGSALILSEAFMNKVSLIGIILALAAMLIFSSYIIITRKVLSNIDVFALSFYLMAIASLILFTNANEDYFKLTWNQFGLAATMGIIPTLLPTVLLYKALKEIGSSMTSITSSIEPAFTMILAHFILKETTAVFQLTGMVLIIIGIAMLVTGDIYFRKRNAVT